VRWVKRLARRIARFVQDKRRLWMGAGPPQNVDRALVLYVIRLIEERTGVKFRFWQDRRQTAFAEDKPPPPLNSSGGPLLRLAEAALQRLFRMFDRKPGPAAPTGGGVGAGGGGDCRTSGGARTMLQAMTSAHRTICLWSAPSSIRPQAYCVNRGASLWKLGNLLIKQAQWQRRAYTDARQLSMG
jgi:hypothetical protein